MKAYRVEKEIPTDGVLQLDALPFQAGERVEIIVLAARESSVASPISVEGRVLEYVEPTEPVANGDWSVLR